MSDESNKAQGGKRPSKGPAGRPPARDVGNVLRGVWQSAVSETVPDEMLDLLRKLD